MGEIVFVNNISLDGVMQSPSGPEEDTRNGFRHGGWASPYFDEVAMQEMGKGMADEGSLLFGRKTYEHFYSYWPHQTDNPFTDVLNRKQKYVVSTTLQDPLPWENSTVLPDAGDSVARLKKDTDHDIVVLGSGALFKSLTEQGLVDQMVLSIHPIVIGSGIRTFPEAGPLDRFDLVSSVPTTTGVIIATYRRNDR